MSFHSKNTFSKSNWFVTALVRGDSGWEVEVKSRGYLFSKSASKNWALGFTKELSG